MNTTNIVLLAAIVTVGGQWAKGKTLTPKIGVGAFVAALGVAAIGNMDVNLGRDFALLILVSSILINGTALFGAIGKATK